MLPGLSVSQAMTTGTPKVVLRGCSNRVLPPFGVGSACVVAKRKAPAFHPAYFKVLIRGIFDTETGT